MKTAVGQLRQTSIQVSLSQAVGYDSVTYL